jgi:hypothetical protein|tara:strand:- start:216 stop:386 length:171 start_codon:yes stop_codon:yes gene_type:complete
MTELQPDEKKLLLRLWKELSSSKDFDNWTASERLAEKTKINSSAIRTFIKKNNKWD